MFSLFQLPSKLLIPNMNLQLNNEQGFSRNIARFRRVGIFADYAWGINIYEMSVGCKEGGMKDKRKRKRKNHRLRYFWNLPYVIQSHLTTHRAAHGKLMGGELGWKLGYQRPMRSACGGDGTGERGNTHIGRVEKEREHKREDQRCVSMKSFKRDLKSNLVCCHVARRHMTTRETMKFLASFSCNHCSATYGKDSK